MICTGTIARLTREAACNWSSRIAIRHAGRAAVGALIGAASGSITAAGLIFRLAGNSNTPPFGLDKRRHAGDGIG
jgi:hypothetical protein